MKFAFSIIMLSCLTAFGQPMPPVASTNVFPPPGFIASHPAPAPHTNDGFTLHISGLLAATSNNYAYAILRTTNGLDWRFAAMWNNTNTPTCWKDTNWNTNGMVLYTGVVLPLTTNK